MADPTDAEPPARVRAVKARLATVRVRTTLAATVVVGLAMVVGALLLVAVLRENLTDGIKSAVDLRAVDVVTGIESGSGTGSLAIDESDDMLVQVVAADGTVVASSHNVDGLPPVVRLSPGESRVITVPIDDTDFLATAHGAETPDGQLVVVVARTIDTVADSTRTVTRLLAVGLPLMLLVVAAITWTVVGRALAPVESIRAEVDEISAAQLHRRVPTPPGEDEISRLATTMNRMLARLEQAQSRQHRFISDASHELRSPVASIRQHAEVALAHPEGTATAELAETVLAENLRVQRLVEDLLLLARADEHALSPDRRPLDLDDIVFDEARRLRDVTELRVETTGVSAGRVDGDAAGLRRVLAEPRGQRQPSRPQPGRVRAGGREREPGPRRRRRRPGDPRLGAGRGARALRPPRRRPGPGCGGQRAGAGHRVGGGRGPRRSGHHRRQPAGWRPGRGAASRIGPAGRVR